MSLSATLEWLGPPGSPERCRLMWCRAGTDRQKLFLASKIMAKKPMFGPSAAFWQSWLNSPENARLTARCSFSMVVHVFLSHPSRVISLKIWPFLLTTNWLRSLKFWETNPKKIWNSFKIKGWKNIWTESKIENKILYQDSEKSYLEHLRNYWIWWRAYWHLTIICVRQWKKLSRTKYLMKSDSQKMKKGRCGNSK